MVEYTEEDLARELEEEMKVEERKSQTENAAA